MCSGVFRGNGRGVISTFSWGAKFFLFFNAIGLLKNWKKIQHFICSNLMLFIVPFFLSFLFFLLFFSHFSFFLYFFFFLFSWGGRPPAPLKWRPWLYVQQYGIWLTPAWIQGLRKVVLRGQMRWKHNLCGGKKKSGQFWNWQHQSMVLYRGGIGWLFIG